MKLLHPEAHSGSTMVTRFWATTPWFERDAENPNHSQKSESRAHPAHPEVLEGSSCAASITHALRLWKTDGLEEGNFEGALVLASEFVVGPRMVKRPVRRAAPSWWRGCRRLDTSRGGRG
jgi:hypothetical protein